MEDKIVKENLEYEQKQAEENLLNWKAYWQEIKEPGCINWGLIKTKNTYRDIKFYENGDIVLDKDPRKKNGKDTLSYNGTFNVLSKNFQIKLCHMHDTGRKFNCTYYCIKRERNWLSRSSKDITIADNIKTKEKRITINTRKRSKRGDGKINGTYQLKIFDDNLEFLFITRKGNINKISLSEFLPTEQKIVSQVNQKSITFLKEISGEIPIEGLSNRVNDYIKDLDNVKIEIPKVFKKAK